ncbi:MAG: DUF4249 family protein [Saprospiraceae bacterium]|nr:DUF4249 family protein [Lewinella sp.]
MKSRIFLSGCLWMGIAMVGISGCLTEITLDVPPGEERKLVIRGALLDGDTSRISVEITYLADFVKFDIPEKVNDAIVVLSDVENHMVTLPAKGEGLYELTIPDGDYPIVVRTGGAYQLSVQLSDGRNYISRVEQLYPVPVPDSVTYTVASRDVINEAGNIEAQEFLRFVINTPLTQPGYSGRPYLKWSFLGTYQFTESAVDVPLPPPVKVCYIFEDVNLENVVTYNGEENSQDELSGFFLLEEPYDYRFSEGFYLTLYQESLSPGAYEYWERIAQVLALSGTFFDAPPGKVRGNFTNIDDPSEEVFGYFYATQRAMMRLYIPPDTRRFSRFCPALIQTEEEDALPTCFNCLLRAGSTLEKPDFWDP